ncbi:hypothetical protein SAMN05216598_4656 [Pseudomonas asplenii]|uniref:DUF3077 family protein n=1 Tax=Pseudomonas asplenii TaxID=53407 RepID=A0A1H1YVQ4_9PSED|nr:hypothetical protein [Pseudomonas asplenii]SDT25463.1 hypothetical protein SAMN05216598_4656 [Pseudomonas asplenii]
MDKKLIPDPPAGVSAAVAERVFAHYGLGGGSDPVKSSCLPKLPCRSLSLSAEERLMAAYSVLQSAAATAYESTDQLDGANCKLAMGVVHLIELAQAGVDLVLEEGPVER